MSFVQSAAANPHRARAQRHARPSCARMAASARPELFFLSPGTSSLGHLRENLGAATLTLSFGNIEELDAVDHARPGEGGRVWRLRRSLVQAGGLPLRLGRYRPSR
jgi:aryl-alcohol dehydrogenase-like predicted oxidoreductase